MTTRELMPFYEIVVTAPTSDGELITDRVLLEVLA